LSYRSGFFRGHAIVRAVRRQPETRSRLGQSGFGLLHTQLVVLLFELRDDLSLAHHAAEIDANCLQPARYFHPDSGLIVGRKISVHGHHFTDRYLGNLDGFYLARL